MLLNPLYVGLVWFVALGIVFFLASRRREKGDSGVQDLAANQEIFKLVHQIGKIGHWEWNIHSDENQWSPEIEALYGLPPGGFTGGYAGWAKLVHPDDLAKAEEDVRRALESGKYYTEFRVIWPDGSVHWLETRATVFKDSEGKPVRIMGVNMDVTERKRAEEELRQSRQKLEKRNEQLAQADRRKDEFLATLAHELRNPLAPITNGLELLRQAGTDSEIAPQALDMMDRQVHQLVRLVDDLLDVSRIISGKVQLRKEQVCLATVLEHAVEISRSLVETGRHELTVKLPPATVLVEADAARLAQVFSNLLNNAAKFTPQGGPLWLIAECQGSDVVLTVKDHGIGIPPAMLHGIFEMFTQVDQTLAQAQGGLGIGLTLVKRLVEMHGGTVQAHSAGEGQGAEFVVRLPIVVSPEQREPLTVNNEKDGSASASRILLVDDNHSSADSLAMVLRFKGHEVATAYDGLEAVASAETFRPHAILLDIGLPKINGYEAARRIRAQPWGQNMVLIALTGWGQDEDRNRSREAGFDHHLVKPVKAAALQELLVRAR